MKKQPKYSWNEENGIAFTTLYYKNRAFIAKAQCHPDDRDMMSKLTGQTIAEYRATLKYLRFIKDYELDKIVYTFDSDIVINKYINNYFGRGDSIIEESL